MTSPPVEDAPGHVEEGEVVRPEVCTQLVERPFGDRRVFPSLRRAEAVRVRCVAHAVEAARAIVKELSRADQRVETQEALHARQLVDGARYEPVAVDDVQAGGGEGGQPARQVTPVDTRVHRPVVGAHLARHRVQVERLERRTRLVARGAVVAELRVVGDEPQHRVAHDENDARVGRQAAYASRRGGRHEVGRRLLDRHLRAGGERHLADVPGDATSVGVVAVEEVHLLLRDGDARVQREELEQRARAALPHADDDAVGRPALELGGGSGGGRGRRAGAGELHCGEACGRQDEQEQRGGAAGRRRPPQGQHHGPRPAIVTAGCDGGDDDDGDTGGAGTATTGDTWTTDNRYTNDGQSIHGRQTNDTWTTDTRYTDDRQPTHGRRLDNRYMDAGQTTDTDNRYTDAGQTDDT